MAILVDLSPLRRHRDFRLLFTGQAVSFIGTQMTAVAVPYQVFRETGSSFAVGLVGIATLVPLVLGALVSGAVIDATDRRRVIRLTSLTLSLISVALALDAAGGSGLLALYGMSALASGVSSLDWPARSAALPRLVPVQDLTAANALMQVQMNVGLVAGPALAGVLLATTDVATLFWVDAASFVAVLVAALVIKPLPPVGGGTPWGLASIREGLGYLRRARLLVSTFVIDIGAMVFGMPRALFPELGERVFGGGPQAVGLLFAAPGLGALFGALLSGWVRRIHRQGRAVIFAVIGWGLAIALAGAAPWLPLALVAFALAGAADTVSAVFRNSITQATTPDHLRGRLSAIFIAVVAGGPRLGDVEAGVAGAALGARASVVTGGLACLVVAALVWRFWPELDAYEVDPTPPHAPADA